MDIRTGKTYETYDDAIKDGASPSDVAKVTTSKGKIRRVEFTDPHPSKYAPHSGKGEEARRRRQMEKSRG